LRTLRERAKIIEDKRGVVMLEYAILIGTVALGSAVAFVHLGKAIAKNFDLVRGLLLCPFP